MDHVERIRWFWHGEGWKYVIRYYVSFSSERKKERKLRSIKVCDACVCMLYSAFVRACCVGKRSALEEGLTRRVERKGVGNEWMEPASCLCEEGRTCSAGVYRVCEEYISERGLTQLYSYQSISPLSRSQLLGGSSQWVQWRMIRSMMIYVWDPWV